MKTILVFCFAFVISTSAPAQKVYRPYYHPRVHTYVGLGLGYYPYYPYYPSPFYYPYYSRPIYSRPTKLEVEIADIKSDYKDKIWSARHDTSLSHSEKKTEVRRLKSERDMAIRNAEYNYHRKKTKGNESAKPTEI